ncbi:MAG: RHS repeat protein [Lysobacter sp.]|nr:RHS repeat protein [Lysobacter sp.]
MKRMFVLAALLLTCLALKPSDLFAQTSDNTFCNVLNSVSACFSTRDAAEADMRSKLPVSYRDVIQPMTPRPAGYQPNSQGLEQWRVDYFIPDQPPAQVFPEAYSNGSIGAPTVCVPAGDPFVSSLCSTENGAAYGLYNKLKTDFPQCTFTDRGYKNSYVTPFASVNESSYRSGYGVASYNNSTLPPSGNRKLSYEIQCPGWAQPDLREINLGKRQTFQCPDRFYAVAGYSSLAYSPNGGGTVIGGKLCRPIDVMPYITFYQRGTATCPAGKHPGPCHPASGDKSRDEVDFQFAGESFTRYYHSFRQAGTLPAFAPGWTHTFSDRVLNGGTYNMKTVRSDGNVEYFFSLGNNQFKSSQTSRKKLVKFADGTYKIYDETGRILSFNTAGRLVRQEQSTNGLYHIDFTYDGEKLIRAQDQTGRVLVFNYVNNRLDSVHLPDGGVVQYEFDVLGNFTRANYPDSTNKQYHYNETALSLANNPHALTGITTENGLRYSSYGYAVNGRVNLSQRHKGDGTVVEKTTIDYPTINQPVVTLPYGEVITYGIVDEGPYRRITSMVNGPRLVNVAYSGGAVSQAIFALSTTKYVYAADYLSERYEAFGTPEERKFVTVRDTSYRTTSYEVQAKSGASYVAKQRQTFGYNSRGQLITANSIDPTTSVTRAVSLSYCEQTDVDAGSCPLVGQLKTVNGARTDVADITTYSYYLSDAAGCVPGVSPCSHRKGDLWKITNALGQVTEILAYSDAGQPTVVADANGVVSNLEYDARGRLTARKRRGTNGSVETDDQITGIEYWPTGLVKKMNMPGGSFVSFVYDDAHRLTGIADNAGNSITYTLNAASRRIKEDTKDSTGTLQRTLSRIYNTLDQLQTVTDAYGRISSFTHDAKDNLDQSTDAQSRIEDSNYDPLDRVTRILRDMNGIAAETQFTYDTLDNLTQVKDPNGLNTNYTYNGFSDLTHLSSPDTGATGYTYDSAGNRASQTDARNVTTSYAYDALNRLTLISYPTSSLNISYTYDTAQAACATGETFTIGRLTKIVDGSGNTVYCYDRFGNRVRQVQNTNGKILTQRYTYSVAGQLTSVIYPDGAVADYVYDTQGRVVEIGAKTATGARQVLLTGATYYPFGSVSEWTYGNGRMMKRSLNLNYEPGFVEVDAPGGISVGYEFDEVGNLKTLRQADQADPPRRRFGYDRLDRLIESKDGVSTAVLEGYTYDKTGNRTSATLGAVTSAYAYLTGTHRLDTAAAAARTYDAIGNTTSISGTARQFVYNDARRLSQFSQNGILQANYAYNGNGEQVQRSGGSSAPMYFAYDDGGHWMGQYDTNTATVQQIIWLDSLPVGVWVGNGAAQKLYYVEADALGSPRVVVDPVRGALGTTVWTWDLAGEAFGNTAPNEDPDGDSTAFVFDMRFPGQRYDAISGLNYNYFRDYDPATGRYMESDPIGLSGGISTYGYVGGSPLNITDSTGLCFDTVCAKCRQDPSFCADLFGDIAQGFADVQWVSGNHCAVGAQKVADYLHRGARMLEAYDYFKGMRRAAKLKYAPVSRVANGSPHIDPRDVAGKTPTQIDRFVKEKGLIPKGASPMAGKGAYIDPVTGNQRVLTHPHSCNGPHCHVNNPAGERLDINGNLVAPESSGAHLPLNYP